jgi:hypothetical protein
MMKGKCLLCLPERTCTGTRTDAEFTGLTFSGWGASPAGDPNKRAVDGGTSTARSSRHKAGPIDREDGWVVGTPDDEIPPVYAAFNYVVETVVYDMNWEGDVFVGGKCVPVPSEEDSIPTFRCVERT